MSLLKGDGDFRSEECIALLQEADIVVTNPPFSLFRECIGQLIDNNKKFLIVSNMNAITYKEVFPLTMQNRMWLGVSYGRNFNGFIVPNSYPLSGAETRIDEYGNKIVSTNNTIWFTNLDHGRRHQPLQLISTTDNLKCQRHKKLYGKENYDKYDNYDAIEVPYTDAIPNDHNGIMGVPISFLFRYCPEQFEIVKFRKGYDEKDLSIKGKRPYFRILIKKKHKGDRI